jgi:hypothetical protein
MDMLRHKEKEEIGLSVNKTTGTKVYREDKFWDLVDIATSPFYCANNIIGIPLIGNLSVCELFQRNVLAFAVVANK